LISFLRRSIQL